MLHLFKLNKLAAIAVLLVLFSSCSKSDDGIISGNAKLTVTYASTNGQAIDVYVDDAKITPAPLSFGTTTGLAGNPYLTVDAGTRNVRISPNGTVNYVQGAIPFETDGTYSIFVLDTLSATSTLKGLILTDNLTSPAAGKAHIRFLHLSPDADTIDVDFAKVGDTTALAGKIYYGRATSFDPALSMFQPINAGVYHVNILKAGTESPVLASLPYTFEAGKIYTVYASGLKSATAGSPLALNSRVILHN